MCRFVESIKIYQGKSWNLPFHQDRLSRTFKKFYPEQQPPRLVEVLQGLSHLDGGLYKCRVLYSEQIKEVHFVPYEERKIKSLKVVRDDQIEYTYKYLDRAHLSRLYTQREECDDILIVKNNCITDAFSSNIIFYDGNEWATPETPLLAGTTRARLLENKKIIAIRISLEDLAAYQGFQLINAMNDFNENEMVKIDRIIL